MSKIKPQTPPSSPLTPQESPSSPPPPDASTQESDAVEIRPSQAETNLLGGPPASPATEGAFSPPGPQATTAQTTPERNADATFMDQLFSVGNARMTGDDILRTIEVIQAMEAVIISSLERQLKSPTPKTTAKRSVLKKLFDPKGTMKVPGPDNKPRTIEVQAVEDHIPSIQDRVLSNAEMTHLRALLKDLPFIIPSDGSNPRRSEFHGRMTRILYQVKVPLHELRELLPIKETGSMVPLSRDATTKPAPEFTAGVSDDLLAKARGLGLLDEE